MFISINGRIGVEFDVVFNKPGEIRLRDRNIGNMSITNGAEKVVEHIYTLHGNKKITYYDTEGELGELIHEKGSFKGYGFFRQQIK